MRDANEMEALVAAARRARMDVTLLVTCVERNLIPLDERGWTDEAVDSARRVRRLMGLGVNLEGVEVVFHMRRRLLRLQSEQARLRAEIEALRAAHERELSRLLRDLATLPPDAEEGVGR